MSSELWVGAITTLSGAALGAVISLVISRQQLKAAYAQRAEDAERELHTVAILSGGSAHTLTFWTKRVPFATLCGLMVPSPSQC